MGRERSRPTRAPSRRRNGDRQPERTRTVPGRDRALRIGACRKRCGAVGSDPGGRCGLGSSDPGGVGATGVDARLRAPTRLAGRPACRTRARTAGACGAPAPRRRLRCGLGAGGRGGRDRGRSDGRRPRDRRVGRAGGGSIGDGTGHRCRRIGDRGGLVRRRGERRPERRPRPGHRRQRARRDPRVRPRVLRPTGRRPGRVADAHPEPGAGDPEVDRRRPGRYRALRDDRVHRGSERLHGGPRVADAGRHGRHDPPAHHVAASPDGFKIATVEDLR